MYASVIKKVINNSVIISSSVIKNLFPNLQPGFAPGGGFTSGTLLTETDLKKQLEEGYGDSFENLNIEGRIRIL